MLLYLLVKDREGNAGSFEVDGCHWSLAEEDLDISLNEKLDFICISYTWGKGRVRSPLHGNFDVSDRTLPALTAAMRQQPSCKRFWIDAFCVPGEPEEKIRTLESMGFIYSIATEVIVVLSNAARGALEEIGRSDRVGNSLYDLEQEEWISRAWTYQEVVNSRALSLTCEDAGDIIVTERHFLQCVGGSLSYFKKTGLDSAHKSRRLGAFEDLIADWMVSGYLERSALQVMSSMDKRTQERPEDHFYAMMATISIRPASLSGTSDCCEAFMNLCERKGDYSFIYSAAKRSSEPSKRWRPVAGDLPPILAWHTYGEGQPGHEEAGSFYLDAMIRLEISPLEDDAEIFCRKWLLRTFATTGQQLPLYQQAYARVQDMGFCGSSHHLSTNRGYFFPLEPVSSDADIVVLVATKVKWNFGAPGLVRAVKGDDTLYSPGAFVGSIEKLVPTSVRMSA